MGFLPPLPPVRCDPAGGGLCAKSRTRSGAPGTRAAPAFANAHLKCSASALPPHDDSALVNRVLINAQFSPQADAIGSKKTQFPRSLTAVSGRRYYNPSQGRFLGRDPIAEKGGLNLYGFCRNNSINRWDMLGMRPDEDPEFFGQEVTVLEEIQPGDWRNVTYRAVLPQGAIEGFDSLIWVAIGTSLRPDAKSSAEGSFWKMLVMGQYDIAIAEARAGMAFTDLLALVIQNWHNRLVSAVYRSEQRRVGADGVVDMSRVQMEAQAFASSGVNVTVTHRFENHGRSGGVKRSDRRSRGSAGRTAEMSRNVRFSWAARSDPSCDRIYHR